MLNKKRNHWSITNDSVFLYHRKLLKFDFAVLHCFDAGRIAIGEHTACKQAVKGAATCRIGNLKNCF